MSTKTTHYNLIKPELTDAADITATNENWDKIDTNLNDFNSRVDDAERKLFDLSDESLSHNLKSYTELSQFGLSDSNLSSTDFASNIDTIITTLDGEAANLMLLVRSDVNSNLLSSLITKINADANETFDATKHFGWLSIQFSGDLYRPVSIEANLESDKYYDTIWSCVFNKESDDIQISEFKTIADYQKPWNVDGYIGAISPSETLTSHSNTSDVLLFGEEKKLNIYMKNSGDIYLKLSSKTEYNSGSYRPTFCVVTIYKNEQVIKSYSYGSGGTDGSIDDLYYERAKEVVLLTVKKGDVVTVGIKNKGAEALHQATCQLKQIQLFANIETPHIYMGLTEGTNEITVADILNALTGGAE